jgi:acetyltransferase-like isoleucine patch superfamily enzyme
MNTFIKLIVYFISLPARLKGMKFGNNSFIGPGYDWIFVTLKGVIVGNDVMIGKNAWFQITPIGNIQPRITVGDGTHIGRNFMISAAQNISIGQKCLISHNVTIVDHDHVVDNPDISPMDSGLTKPEEITIADDCFIGAHSFILKGVHLGTHCVVGANSVVTKSFPAYTMVAGSPARLIKKLK